MKIQIFKLLTLTCVAVMLGSLAGCSTFGKKKNGDQQYTGTDSDSVNGTPLPDRQEGVSFTSDNVDKSKFRPVHFAFDSAFGHDDTSRRGNEQSHDIQLRFAASVALTLRDTPGPPGQKILPGPDGTIELFFKVELLEDVVLWIFGFGDQVEVIEPDQLRLAVRAQAERIAHIHSR